MRAHAGDAARLLRVLANDKRLMLLCLLVEGELSVGELNAKVDLSQSALSQHLAVLREECLVSTRREAKLVFYTLDGAVLAELAQAMSSLVPEETQASAAKASGPHASGHGAAVFATIQR